MIPIENYSAVVEMATKAVPLDSVCFYPEWYFHAWVFLVAMVTLGCGLLIGYRKGQRG